MTSAHKRALDSYPGQIRLPVPHDLDMPGGATLLFFAVATFLLTVAPGPGVLYVTARSLSQGRQAGFVSMFGIEAGEVVWIFAAATGARKP